MSDKPLTGRTVFLITASAFGVIITVNLIMAVQAVRTFPGLEVRNSYVASQSFDAERAAQEALGWTTRLDYEEGELVLRIIDRAGAPVRVASLEATIGRPTHVADDRTPDFTYWGGVYVASEDLAPGIWDLRLKALSEDGTAFHQRLEISVRARP